MLVRLFGKNFGVFRDEFDLNLEALDLGADEDRGYFEVDVEGEDKPLRLLRLAAIYGPNGSGKSTIIKAADALDDLVGLSAPSGQEALPIMQYNPFLLDEYSRRDPTVLGCVFTSARRLMEYQITFNGKEVIAERLLQRVGDTEKPWFERRAPRRTEIYPENFPGELSINLEGVTRANAAVISTAAHLAQEPLLDIFNSIRSSLRVLICTPVIASLPYSLQRWKDDPDFRNWILNTLLRRADIGIRDIKVEKRRIPDDIIDHMRKLMPEGSPPPPEILEPVFSHEGENDVYSLEFDTQSTGTQKLVAIAGPWYDVIRGRKTLFVDELSSSLHPNLLEALLEALNPSKDAPHAQIVFTLHDPTPLQEVLRRDQVYFTEKDKFGRASLFSLANFKERQVSNLRKRYLEGRYGAIPHLGKFDFLKEPEEVE